MSKEGLNISNELESELKSLADIIFQQTIDNLIKYFVGENRSEFLALLEKVKSYKNGLIIQTFINSIDTNNTSSLQKLLIDAANNYLETSKKYS